MTLTVIVFIMNTLLCAEKKHPDAVSDKKNCIWFVLWKLLQCKQSTQTFSWKHPPVKMTSLQLKVLQGKNEKLQYKVCKEIYIIMI